MNLVNAKYGREPGLKAYTHLSDQFAPFATQTIPATVHEAPYILDGLPHERRRAARARAVCRHRRLYRPCLRRDGAPRIPVHPPDPGLAIETSPCL